MRRMARGDMPPDPARVVRALRSCREAMIELQGRVRPTGPIYHGAAMVVAAIDGFATLLTGERYHLAAAGFIADEGRQEGLTADREDKAEE